MTIADANDCRAEEIISLNVPLSVSVELGDNLLLSVGDSAVIEAIVNLPFDSIAYLVWTGIDSMACPTCLTQLVSPVITTAYTVSVTTTDGCTDQDSLEIQVSNSTDHVYSECIFPKWGWYQRRICVYAISGC